ncbi:MAG: hypothetical protein Q4B13_05465 [Lautropia sp.]|nr:hypothetical protein [Lautropia sp.]
MPIFNESIDLKNKGTVSITVFYFLAGVVMAIQSLRHYLRARRETADTAST